MNFHLDSPIKVIIFFAVVIFSLAIYSGLTRRQ